MSVYDLALGVADSLKARKFPISVFYGPDRILQGVGENRITIERDRDGGDTIETAHGAIRNARKVASRLLGARARVWVKCSKSGATSGEHERECEQFVDGLYSAIRDWMQTHAHIATFPIVEARYLKAAELDSPETWGGAVYQLRWKLPRGVFKSAYSPTYAIVGDPTGAAAAIAGDVLVSREAAPDDEQPEVVKAFPPPP